MFGQKLHFIPPNFEEVEGAYWFGPSMCMCLWLLRITYGQEQLEIGS